METSHTHARTRARAHAHTRTHTHTRIFVYYFETIYYHAQFSYVSMVKDCTIFQILKKICFSIMAVLICIHIICILNYNILSDSMIILDHGSICVDTNFMIFSCIIFKILTKFVFSIMAVLICIHIYAYS